jgi:NTE family protein
MSAQTDRARKSQRKTHKAQERPPFECIALLLQGGGALGAYQAGVYEALAEAHLQPDWVAGISIGAINSALIAGNPPEKRVQRLREFWEAVTVPPFWDGVAQLSPKSETSAEPFQRLLDQATTAAASLGAMSLAMVSNKPLPAHANRPHDIWDKTWLHEFWDKLGGPKLPFHPSEFGALLVKGDVARGVANWMSANLALMRGTPGFFAPRLPPPWLQPAGSVEATSYYDTAPLLTTLERLVDFDRINSGEMRFSVGSVNVTTGNFIYFDNETNSIGPKHVIASGALPPGFPPVEIEGEYYWDGGLVSNTPLSWVLERVPRQDTLAFQVDLWSSRGAFPRNIAEVSTRQKEIQYSSRTRANSDRFNQMQKLRSALANLLEKLPEDLKDTPEFALLHPMADRKVYNIIQLIYRSKEYEGDSKDYEFSRLSMEDHWRAGYHDTVRTLRHPEVLERPKDLAGVYTFDLAKDGRE